MTQTTLTALYDTRGDADTAAERLVTEIGLARSAITVTAPELDTTEEGGFFASLKNLLVPDQDRAAYAEGVRRGGFLLAAQVEQGSAARAMDILEEHGAVDLDDRQQTWRAEQPGEEQIAGAAAMADGTVVTPMAVEHAVQPTTAAAPIIDRQSAEEEKIELVEETLRVGKRAVGVGRVRVRSYVVEAPVEEQVSLREERVSIEHRPVDGAPIAANAALFGERVIEASEMGEEVVVAKEALVTGEVVLRKATEERIETVRDTVRRTEVEVNDDRTADAAVRSGAPTSPAPQTDPAPRR